MSPAEFSTALLDWHDKHGRHDLPWQQELSPYRVWISEIMLQQTQVATVIPYFARFMQSFPSLADLAHASIDDVLHHWTGLGYYARARNLHRTARLIMEQYAGNLPLQLDKLIELPGIGRSTAAAILAISDNQHHAILDGNVKRVLTRFFAIDGWPGKRNIEQCLWQHAERLTPKERVAQYTQAIMDLGATRCTRRNPDCAGCPLHAHCRAYASQSMHRYPAAKPRKTLPVKQTIMLLLRDNENRVLLQQRPSSGIWGGLWSLPEVDFPANKNEINDWSQRQLGLDIEQLVVADPVRHSFSHFHLDITPVYARVIKEKSAVMDQHGSVWYNTCEPDARGLAAPVKKLLDTHNEHIAGVKR